MFVDLSEIFNLRKKTVRLVNIKGVFTASVKRSHLKC